MTDEHCAARYSRRAGSSEKGNCEAKVFLCNGMARAGLFARNFISPNEPIVYRQADGAASASSSLPTPDEGRVRQKRRRLLPSPHPPPTTQPPDERTIAAAAEKEAPTSEMVLVPVAGSEKDAAPDEEREGTDVEMEDAHPTSTQPSATADKEEGGCIHPQIECANRDRDGLSCEDPEGEADQMGLTVVSEPQPPRSTNAAPSQSSRNEKEKQPPPPSMQQLKTQPVSERTPGVSHVRSKNRWVVTFLDHKPCSGGGASSSSSCASAPATATGSSDHQPVSSSSSDPSHPASLSCRITRTRHFNTEQEALEFVNSLPKNSRLNRTRDEGLKKEALSFLEAKGLLPQNHPSTANQSTDDRKEKESRLCGVYYLALPKKRGAGVVEYWQTQMYLKGRTRNVYFSCKQYGFYQARSLAEAIRLFYDRGEFPQQKSTQACAENVPHSGSVLNLNRYHMIHARNFKQPSTPSSSSGHANRSQREISAPEGINFQAPAESRQNGEVQQSLTGGPRDQRTRILASRAACSSDRGASGCASANGCSIPYLDLLAGGLWKPVQQPSGVEVRASRLLSGDGDGGLPVGLFSRTSFRPGELVAEIWGDVYDCEHSQRGDTERDTQEQEQAQQQEEEKSPPPTLCFGSFLFVMTDEKCAARYARKRCDRVESGQASCEARMILCNGLPRAGLFALTFVSPNEEIVFTLRANANSSSSCRPPSTATAADERRVPPPHAHPPHREREREGGGGARPPSRNGSPMIPRASPSPPSNSPHLSPRPPQAPTAAGQRGAPATVAAAAAVVEGGSPDAASADGRSPPTA